MEMTATSVVPPPMSTTMLPTASSTGTVVAGDVRTDVVKYVGQAAKDVIGRTPGSIMAIRPLKDGVIADFDVTASMLQW